ncbi:MAG: phosphoribosylaminoimidazolesuccinocarboxamide synthase, partial [Chlamydiia bacterium]|nr:phosphoribosylaminoimidazolesuccinocarboxamide synthase [Chlamydiia bacterium]
MNISTLATPYLPELGSVRRGKVRDIYESADGSSLIMIASDRVSCFDVVLGQQVPDKGRVLTGISNFWFQNTSDIVPNHIIACPDPNVVVARKCRPLPVEVIMRGYLCGSLWRAYQKGERNVCGVQLPDGMQENQAFDHPILTPTTKAHEGHDENISAAEIVSQGLVDANVWKHIEELALALFCRGQEIARTRGLELVDTKYEFGVDTQGDLVLIDEIHTPDSSRFWMQEDLDRNIVRFPDKEFLRSWLRTQGWDGSGAAPVLTDEVIAQTAEGYRSLYERITGQALETESVPVQQRLLAHLQSYGTLRGCCAIVLAGSRSDEAHVAKICEGLEAQGIPHRAIYASAHKQPQEVADFMQEINRSIEPTVLIAVAGMSNALGGVLAANVRWPVINCPPFKDQADYMVNIHSSLQMPRDVPAMTVIHPRNAALATAK